MKYILWKSCAINNMTQIPFRLIWTAGPLNLTNIRPRFAAIKGQAARVDSFSDDKFHTKDGDSKKLTPTEAAAAPGNTRQQWTV